MWNAFEQFPFTQDIHKAQLAEIVESTCRYADVLAHQRASMNRQEVMLAHVCSGFMPDQGITGEYIAAKPLSVFQKGGLLDHFENHIYYFSYTINGFHAIVNVD
ncbi:hypothetical protein M9H77_02190 [Catharanthus roseus]|uniref:Uncharacterized protein n=1 Tax=Catharanthus roseus TaxID=4058 RepID=A0ACC0C7L9_CATRO|nr:hypothetical protein M9H77_02190 [Catharanthus roseus]